MISDRLIRKTPYATEQIAVAASPVTLTVALVKNAAGAETDGSTPARWSMQNPATAVLVEAKTADIIYTMDGSTPSASNGMVLSVNEELMVFDLQKILNLKMVQAAGAAVANVTYFKN